MSEKEKEVRRALIALRLEVPESVASDIESLVIELIEELKSNYS